MPPMHAATTSCHLCPPIDLLSLTPPHSDIVHFLIIPTVCRKSPPSLDGSVARHHHHLPPVPLVAVQTNHLDLMLPPSDIVLLSLPKHLPSATSISFTSSPPLAAGTACRRQSKSLLPHTTSPRYHPPLVVATASRAQHALMHPLRATTAACCQYCSPQPNPIASTTLHRTQVSSTARRLSQNGLRYIMAPHYCQPRSICRAAVTRPNTQLPRFLSAHMTIQSFFQVGERPSFSPSNCRLANGPTADLPAWSLQSTASSVAKCKRRFRRLACASGFSFQKQGLLLQ